MISDRERCPMYLTLHSFDLIGIVWCHHFRLSKKVPIQMPLRHYTSLFLYTTHTHTIQVKARYSTISSVLLPFYTHSYSQWELPGIYFLRESSGIFSNLVTNLIIEESQRLAFFTWQFAGGIAHQSTNSHGRTEEYPRSVRDNTCLA